MYDFEVLFSFFIVGVLFMVILFYDLFVGMVIGFVFFVLLVLSILLFCVEDGFFVIFFW